MALFDDDEWHLLIGIGVGIAAAGLIRGAAPAFRGVGRPLAKATIKSSLTLFDKGREKLAQFSEVFEDLVAEARADLDEQAREKAGPHPEPERLQ